jgi:hypothetical protein
MTVHDMMTLVTVYDGLAGSVVFCAHDVFDIFASGTETTFFQSPDPDPEYKFWTEQHTRRKVKKNIRGTYVERQSLSLCYLCHHK